MIAILSSDIIKTLKWIQQEYKVYKITRARFIETIDGNQYVIIQNKEQVLGLILEDIIKAPDYVSLEDECLLRVRNYSLVYWLIMITIIGVQKQIVKSLFESLRACNANFRYSNNKSQFDILNVDRIYGLESNPDDIAFTFKVLDNTTNNTVYIHKGNIISLEINNDRP